MTKQHELIALGEKHNANPGVAAVLLSITEAQAIAKGNLGIVKTASETLALAAAFVPGYGVSPDHSDFVANAAKAAAALSVLNANCLTLATLLQALGEPISY